MKKQTSGQRMLDFFRKRRPEPPFSNTRTGRWDTADLGGVVADMFEMAEQIKQDQHRHPAPEVWPPNVSMAFAKINRDVAFDTMLRAETGAEAMRCWNRVRDFSDYIVQLRSFINEAHNNAGR